MKRKVLNEVFNFSFIKSLAPVIAKLCDKILTKIDDQEDGDEKEFNIMNYCDQLTGNVILECFFG